MRHLIAASLLALTGTNVMAQTPRVPTGTLTAPNILVSGKQILDAYQLPCSGVTSVEVYDTTHMGIICASGEKYATVLGPGTAYAVPWVSPDHLANLQIDPVALARAQASGYAQPGSAPAPANAPAAASANAPVVEPPRTATAAQLNALAVRSKEILDSSLLDFPSARIRSVRAVWVYARQNGQPVGSPWVGFCGQVNAKNRTGAYGGWKTFYVSPDAPDGLSFGLAGDRNLGGIVAAANCELHQLSPASERDFAPTLQP